jgi:DNA-binding CsgD family transcriptional regulator
LDKQLPAAPLRSEGAHATGSDFVRAAEWQRVRAFAGDAATRKEPAALVITGEAGAGKSSLWHGAVETAAEAGCLVLRSEPSAREADSSFSGLSDLLAEALPAVADGIPAPQLEALEIALLLRPSGDEPPATHVIGRAVLAALRSLATRGPVLLAIDDVQWLDMSSHEALAFALRRIAAGPQSALPPVALSMLLSARTEAPADPRTVGEPPPSQEWRGLLTGFSSSARISLAPLDEAQVQALLPPAATAAQASQVVSQSRGNPFWALEVWASMTAADSALPPLARATLAGHIADLLPESAAQALAVVAAAGRIRTPDAIAILDRDHVANPAAALDAAVLSRVVVESGGRLAAAHPLIGAAAIAAVPPARRAAIYRRLAEVSGNPERRAQFVALAAGAGPDPAVAEALDIAAEAAHARAANAAAAKFATQAVAFTAQEDVPTLVRRRIRAGELLFAASDLAGAREHFEALDIDALPTPDLERVLPALVDVVEFMSGGAAATAMITRVLEGAGPDNRRRAVLLSLASDYVYGIPGRRRAAADEAIHRAEAAGPTAYRSLHKALINLAVAKVTGAEGIDAELLDRAERLEATLPGIPLHDSAGLHRALWSGYTEDLRTARPAMQRCITRAREAGEDLLLAIFLSHRALAEELAGGYAEAAEILAEVGDLEGTYDWPVNPWQLEPQCELLIAAGELESARRLADENLPGDSPQLFTRFMGAYLPGKVSSWTGDCDATIRHLELARRYADEFGWTDPGVRRRIDQLLAEAYVVAGATDEAARISAFLRDLGARMNRPTLTGDASRIDALVATAQGDLDAAVACARAAVAAHEASPLAAELPRSLLVLGRVERRRKARAECRAALQRARDLAALIGHRPLLAQVTAELPRATAARSAQPGSTLTEAEERVAAQIADGATSREAAARLYVSVRTIDTHIASIYRKLGITTRSELRRTLTRRRDADEMTDTTPT